MSRVAALGATLALIAVPVTLVPIEAAHFYVVNADNASIISSGVKREYTLYVPKTYDASKPTPLILSFHGAALWGVSQRDISKWNEVADREGLIVAYPSAIGGRQVRAWHEGPGRSMSRDVRFVSDLIDTLSAKYNIDPTRIYANGLSNGGGMSFALSCRLSNRIAAVGLVSSALLLPFEWCGDSTPVPVIDMHGTDDHMAPYHGGGSVIARRFYAQRPFIASWAERNRCVGPPVESRVASDVMLRSYSNCAQGADVQLYTIERGGHTWPGGGDLPTWYCGRIATSISATETMWKFFRQHPLKR